MFILLNGKANLNFTHYNTHLKDPYGDSLVLHCASCSAHNTPRKWLKVARALNYATRWPAIEDPLGRNGCFLLNEHGDLSFFGIIYVRNKRYSEKSIRSNHSWTQNYVFEITHPRNTFSQYLFMSCARAIKQTLN